MSLTGYNDVHHGLMSLHGEAHVENEVHYPLVPEGSSNSPASDRFHCSEAITMQGG